MMMSSKFGDNGTSPGGSDSLQEATPLTQQGRSVGSNGDPKTTGVPAQASVGTHVGVQLCAQQEKEIGKQGEKVTVKQTQTVEAAFRASATNTQQKPGMTRAQTEAKYGHLLDAVKGGIEKLEAAVSAATNTKTEIKTSTRDLGVTFREFLKVSKALGLTRTGDTSEQRLAAIMKTQQQQQQLQQQQYQQQQQQHQQLIEASSQTSATLAEIQRQIRTHEEKLTAMTAAPTSRQAERRQQHPPQQKEQQHNSPTPKPQKKEHEEQVATKQPKKTSQPSTSGAPPTETAWTEVGKRGKRARPNNGRREETEGLENANWSTAGQPDNRSRRTRDEDAEALVRRRTPRTEAVTISEPAEGETYASVMRTVMSSVKLTDIGVEIGAVRRTRTGGILLQVKNKEEADKLSGRLQSAVGNIAKIGRPTRTTPVLITNVPDWMDDSEVEEQIRASDPSLAGVTARIRENTGGGKVATIVIPMEIASKMATAGRVKIGWSLCRVKLLERKKPICHRCQKPGHFKVDCKATEAERLCYRCRQGGHLIKDCPGRPPTSRPSTGDGDSVSGLRAASEGNPQ